MVAFKVGVYWSQLSTYLSLGSVALSDGSGSANNAAVHMHTLLEMWCYFNTKCKCKWQVPKVTPHEGANKQYPSVAIITLTGLVVLTSKV